MRLLDLADKSLRVYLNDIGGNQNRLVIVYPREPEYRARILGALADILRPEPQPERNQAEQEDDREAAA